MKIGLIGCGRWGSNILRDLRRLGREVVVVARSERTQESVRRYLVDRDIVSSTEELPDVDGIVVATPTSTHAEVVARVASKGVPIFVEKPLASSLKDAERLRECLPGKIFVMDKWRYHQGVQAIRARVKDGSFGPLVGLRTVRAQAGNPHPDVSAVWTYLPHDLSIALEVIGYLPRPRAAVSDQEGEVFTAMLGGSPWVVSEISSRDHRKLRRVTAIFREATLNLYTDGSSSSLYISQEDEQDALVRFPFTEPLYDELAAFVNYLEGAPAPRSSLEEGIGQVKLIEELVMLSRTC